MTKEQQIIEVAKLDGWQEKPLSIRYLHKPDYGLYPPGLHPLSKINTYFIIPHYLTSYDDILPVIIAVITTDDLKLDFHFFIGQLVKIKESNPIEVNFHACLTASPTQLAEVLLRATGKWKD